MALTGAQRTARYRERARERGESLGQLPPIPQSQRAAVAKVISLAIVLATKVKNQNDRARLVQFWRSLARSQGLDLERNRLALAIEHRLRAQAAAQERAAE